jgi:hypothetical protein
MRAAGRKQGPTAVLAAKVDIYRIGRPKLECTACNRKLELLGGPERLRLSPRNCPRGGSAPPDNRAINFGGDDSNFAVTCYLRRCTTTAEARAEAVAAPASNLGPALFLYAFSDQERHSIRNDLDCYGRSSFGAAHVLHTV